MASWQDLKDELDRLEALTEGLPIRFAPSPLEAVARRVLALWQPCDQCGGQGWYHPQPAPDGEREGCLHCGRTGVEETAAFPKPYGATIGRHGYALQLARFLFGEGEE